MTSAGWDLQQAVYQVLVNDAPLTALLGGARIYDDVPRDADYPYITFGQATQQDWATDAEAGHEHVLNLHVWSRENGRKQVHEIADLVRLLLHDQLLDLVDHRLINLRHEVSQSGREPDGETYRGLMRFRAITEPNSG